jgi:hypothetical protein
MWDALNPKENPLPSSLYARHWLSRSPLAENLGRFGAGFTEGFDTVDLKAAREVLDELA